MMRTGWLGLGLAVLVTLAGCGQGTQKTSSSTSGGGGKLRVGMVLDKGGLGDKSFNDSAWTGMQRAQSDLGIEVVKIESKEEKDYEGNLAALTDQGLDLVIAVGSNMKTALEQVAKQNPKTKYAIVDETLELPNVRSLIFKEQEGSFLVGYLAGLMSKTKKVGFVGGQDIPVIKKFEVGYAAGVKTADPSVELLPAKHTGDWDNVDTAKEAANILFSQGADIVYHAAGRAGLGVIRAAKERGKYAIGVDRDQDDEAPGAVLTSMVKRVDQAVFDTISDLKAGKFTAGPKVYDLKQGGVGISALRFTKDVIGKDRLAKLDAITKRVASGEIQVPGTDAEMATFKAPKSP